MSTNSFFRQFPKFHHNTEAPIAEEFKRLGRQRNWKPGSKKWKKEWNVCMGFEYDRLIGKRLTSLATWQQLCDKLGLKGRFTSINQCKKALSHVYVNIVDLLDCWRTDETPRRFDTVHELAKYTKEEYKYFSRNLAKQDKLLRVLLKKIV